MIQPTEEGPWNSNVFLVPKKTPRKWRLVGDYRYDNTQKEEYAHPTPLIEHLIDKHGKYEMWTIMNPKQRYYQIPLRARNRDITGFRALGIRYRWRVMPMGVRNAPATCQRLMDWDCRKCHTHVATLMTSSSSERGIQRRR